jgi:hypothetical protein
MSIKIVDFHYQRYFLEQVCDSQGNDSRFFRMAAHRMRFPRRSLTICEYDTIVSIDSFFDDLFYTRIVDPVVGVLPGIDVV